MQERRESEGRAGLPGHAPAYGWQWYTARLPRYAAAYGWPWHTARKTHGPYGPWHAGRKTLVAGAVAAGFARNLMGPRVFQAVQGMASLCRAAGQKGSRNLFPEGPGGCYAEKDPGTFLPARFVARDGRRDIIAPSAPDGRAQASGRMDDDTQRTRDRRAT